MECKSVDFDKNNNFDIFFFNDNILYKNHVNNYLEKLFKNKEYPTFNYVGGAKSKINNSNIKRKFLKVLPTIINIIKGRVIYNLQTKLPLIEIKNKNKTLKMGIIVDVYNILNHYKKETITKQEIVDYITSFQVVPLFFNDEDKDEIFFNNKKKSFLTKNSELYFVIFKIDPKLKLYISDIESKQYSKFVDEEKIIQSKEDFMVAHYIYNNFFMLNTDPKNTLTFVEMYRILEKDLELEKIDDDEIKIKKYKLKMSLDDINEIINKCIKNHLTKIKIFT